MKRFNHVFGGRGNLMHTPFFESLFNTGVTGQMPRLGFTLAEVLITLGIVGVVAALTIPNLISNYKKLVVETQLKKTYTILNQVVKRSEADNGSALNWDWKNTYNGKDADAFFDKYFAPYLNLNGKKSSFGNGRYFDIYANNSQVTSWSYNNGNNAQWRLLSDGSAVMFDLTARDNVFLGGFNVVLPASVKKKRLVMGRDVFLFTINYLSDKSAVTVFPQSWGNWNCKNVSDNKLQFNQRCNGDNNSGDGIAAATYCSVILYCNGWKVPDDYPIRF